MGREISPSLGQSQNRALSGAVLIFAGILGLAAGLAITVSPWMQTAGHSDQPMRVRVSLPLTVIVDDSSDEPGAVADTPALGGQSEFASDRSTSTETGEGGTQRATGTFDPVDRPIPTGPSGILALDYDLAQFAAANSRSGASDGSIDTRMPLLVNGIASGDASIRVADNAEILISTSSLARAIGPLADTLPPRLSSALSEGSGFVPFYELRAAKIDVAYDPVNNRIALTLPS